MTSRSQNLIVGIGIALGVPLLTVFAPLVYFGLPVTSSVVDAASGQPVAGVTVIAKCTMKGGHGVTTGQAMVMEAVTDKDGVFHFPWWGPSFASGRLRATECPGLHFFKTGYSFAFRGNDGLATLEYRTPPMVHYLDHQDVPVKMEKLTGGVEEEFKEYKKLNDELEWVVGSNSENTCGWKSIPHTIKRLIELRKYFVENGKTDFNSFETGLLVNEKYFRDQGCGSAKKFLESLNQ